MLNGRIEQLAAETRGALLLLVASCACSLAVQASTAAASSCYPIGVDPESGAYVFDREELDNTSDMSVLVQWPDQLVGFLPTSELADGQYTLVDRDGGAFVIVVEAR